MRLFLFSDMYMQCYKFLSQPSFSCVPHFDMLYIRLHWVLCIFKFYFNTSFLIYGLFRSMNLHSLISNEWSWSPAAPLALLTLIVTGWGQKLSSQLGLTETVRWMCTIPHWCLARVGQVLLRSLLLLAHFFPVLWIKGIGFS